MDERLKGVIANQGGSGTDAWLMQSDQNKPWRSDFHSGDRNTYGFGPGGGGIIAIGTAVGTATYINAVFHPPSSSKTYEIVGFVCSWAAGSAGTFDWEVLPLTAVSYTPRVFDAYSAFSSGGGTPEARLPAVFGVNSGSLTIPSFNPLISIRVAVNNPGQLFLSPQSWFPSGTPWKMLPGSSYGFCVRTIIASTITTAPNVNAYALWTEY